MEEEDSHCQMQPILLAEDILALPYSAMAILAETASWSIAQIVDLCKILPLRTQSLIHPAHPAVKIKRVNE
jgi:hypothetical protein